VDGGSATRSRAVGGAPGVAGWVAVAAVFVLLAVTTGLTFYSVSAYVAALTEERGLSLGVASSGPTVFFICSGLGGLLAARLLPRLGARRLLPIGAIGTAAAFVVLGLTWSPWSLWLSFAISGGAGAMMTVVPCTSLVARWFHPTPAKALVIATTGMSAGGATVPPFVVALIERHGLERTANVLAVVVVVVALTVSFAVREAPARALHTHTADGDDPGPTISGSTVDERRKPWLFPVLCLALGLLMLSQVGAVTHLLTIARDRGIHDGEIALSALAISSVGARLLGIPLLAGVGMRRFTCGVAALQALSMGLLAFADNLLVLGLSAALLGATVGNAVVLMPLHMLTAFGLGRFERAYSRLNLVATIGTASGPLVLGVLHEMSGGYVLPLLLAGTGSFVAAVLLFTARVDTEARWAGSPGVGEAS